MQRQVLAVQAMNHLANGQIRKQIESPSNANSLITAKSIISIINHFLSISKNYIL